MNNENDRNQKLRQLFDDNGDETWNPIEYKNNLIAKYRKLSGNQEPAPSIITMEDWLIKYMADFVPIPKFKPGTSTPAPGTGMIQETGPEKIAWWNEPDPAKRFEMKVPHFDAGRFGYCPELNAGIIQPKCDKDPEPDDTFIISMDLSTEQSKTVIYEFTPGAKNTISNQDPDMQEAIRKIAGQLNEIRNRGAARQAYIDNNPDDHMVDIVNRAWAQAINDMVREHSKPPAWKQWIDWSIRKFKNICRDLWNTIKQKRDDTKTTTDQHDDIDRAFFHDKL